MEALVCPLCALQVSDSPEAFCIEAPCPLCGAALQWDVSRLDEREREVFTALSACAFGKGLENPRTLAMACWLNRRQEARGNFNAERENLEERARFDVSARLQLAFLDKVDSRSESLWDEWLEQAPSETLQAIVDLNAMSDAELEAVIWRTQ